MTSEEELANLQKLSNEYEPDVQGPLVGARQSTQAISTEYAHADPIYIRKTAALSHKYSHYRTVKGDGNCGYRACAFGYFEALLRLGDPSRIAAEESRLGSLNNVLRAAGIQEFAYEDFYEETISMLKACAAALPCQDDGAALLEWFNDYSKSSAIIAHFRMITSAWIKTHSHMYEPYMEGRTAEEYCSTQIEPYRVEIEDIGLNALVDAIIKPAGMTIEVLYLDRSELEEVNAIPFEPQNSAGQAVYPDAPIIRLLYRPGHYDLLYKIEDIAELMASVIVPQHVDHQINILSSFDTFAPNPNFTFSAPAVDTDYETLSFIPGLQFNGSSIHGFSDPGYPMDSFQNNALSTSPLSPIPADPYPPPAIPPAPHPPERRGSGFRPSKYELEAGFRHRAVLQAPCETPAMRNNGACPAHFRSENFQPEIVDPSGDYRIRGRR